MKAGYLNCEEFLTSIGSLWQGERILPRFNRVIFFLPNIAQYWDPGKEAPEVANAAQRGNEIIVSPASRAYLDMKYNEDTELGLDYAGLTTVKNAYRWDRGSLIEGVDESSVKEPKTALWSETLETFDDIAFMLFPRLPVIAELG